MHSALDSPQNLSPSNLQLLEINDLKEKFGLKFSNYAVNWDIIKIYLCSKKVLIHLNTRQFVTDLEEWEC